MKRFLSILIAGVTLMAAVLIPLDAKRSHPIEIHDPAGEPPTLSAEENSTGAASGETRGPEAFPVPEASGGETQPHSAEEAEAPAEAAQEPGGTQQKQASTKASQSPQAESARPAPTTPRATKPSATKPAATEQATSGIKWPTRPVQLPAQPATRPPQTPTKPAAPDTGSGNQSYVDRVVELVNQERAKGGLKPLTVNRSAEAAALVRAKETEKSFSHTRPNGSSFSTALTEQGVSYRTAGENIAWGQRSPEQVMQGWMNSAGHRANIMNPKFTSIGVGYYRSASGTNYWTQLFIG